MLPRTVSLVALLVLGPSLAIAATSPGKGMDAAEIQKAIGPAICRATVENAWGVQLAVGTAFLLGNGQFAVADLGLVSHPGSAKVRLDFEDGTTAEASQFGMADPALGLVALRIEGSAPSRPGLALAPELPPLDGSTSVAAMGWTWADRPELVTGRLLRGPKITEIAARVQVDTAAGVDAFLRMEGGRVVMAGGAPVVDASGTVLAVRMDVAARNLAAILMMPASSLRQSLMSTQPELKPLSELPKPLWPVNVLRLKGEPTTVAEMARAAQAIKTAMVCQTCEGRGKVDTARGMLGFLGRTYVTCPVCQGSGVSINDDVFALLGPWAEHGARMVWSPTMDDRSRVQVRLIGAEILKPLAQVGNRWRGLRNLLPGVPLAQLHGALPHGTAVYARVEGIQDGPDGKYVILDALNIRTPLAVRATDLAVSGSRGPTPGRQPPAVGSWIVLAGAAVSRFETDLTHRGVFVLPFEWGTAKAPAAEDPWRGPPPGRDERGPPGRGDPGRGDPGGGDPGDRRGRG